MSERSAIPRETRVAVLTEAGYRCGSPNCTNELTVDIHHLVEVCNVGSNEPSNLLPLCPYCHDKFHRGLIDRRSVTEWKARVRKIYEASIQHPEQVPQPAHANGYSEAFSSFTRRTYPVWYFYDYQGRRKFYPAGYATYIGRNCLVTSRAVLDRLDHIRTSIPDGRARLVLGFSTLDFAVSEIHTWGGIVVLKSRPFEERENWPPESAKASDSAAVTPDEGTAVTIAPIPFVGQEVAFLYGASGTDCDYPIWHYALGTSTISSFLSTSPTSMDRYVLLPLAQRVELLGGPVFLRDGTLVGVLTWLGEGEALKDSHDPNPLVVGGFFGVKRLWKRA